MVDSSQAYDHHAENDKIHEAGRTQVHGNACQAEITLIDYGHVDVGGGNGMFSLTARELGQRIVGECSGRSLHGEATFQLVIPTDALAGVLVALVGSAWKVAQRTWGVPGNVTIQVWTD